MVSCTCPKPRAKDSCLKLRDPTVDSLEGMRIHLSRERYNHDPALRLLGDDDDDDDDNPSKWLELKPLSCIGFKMEHVMDDESS